MVSIIVIVASMLANMVSILANVLSLLAGRAKIYYCTVFLGFNTWFNNDLKSGH